MATTAPNGTPNQVATDALPNLKSAGSQIAIALLSGGAAYYSHSPMWRASYQGITIGAGLHLGGDLFRGLMAKALKGTALGQRLYLTELVAQNAEASAAGAAAVFTPLSGPPTGVGMHTRVFDPGPRAGVGADLQPGRRSQSRHQRRACSGRRERFRADHDAEPGQLECNSARVRRRDALPGASLERRRDPVSPLRALQHVSRSDAPHHDEHG